jgi:hypothetical protein
MGGTRAYKYGEGNAEKNRTEDDFIEWKSQMWPDLVAYYKSINTEDNLPGLLKRVSIKGI